MSDLSYDCLIRSYVEEKEIVRPQDMIVQQAATGDLRRRRKMLARYEKTFKASTTGQVVICAGKEINKNTDRQIPEHSETDA